MEIQKVNLYGGPKQTTPRQKRMLYKGRMCTLEHIHLMTDIRKKDLIRAHSEHGIWGYKKVWENE